MSTGTPPPRVFFVFFTLATYTVLAKNYGEIWDGLNILLLSLCHCIRFQEQEEQVTERVTEQFIRNLHKKIIDVDKLAELLELPVEQVKKALNKQA